MGFTDAHALRPVVTTPFPAPNVMDLTMFKERKESMYWGTYRPQAYFGVRVRDPHPLVAGLMWLVSEQNEPVMRHFCEDKHGLKLFGWTEHNGTDYGQQDLVEKDLVLQTSFVKSKENMFGQVKLSDTAEDDSNVYVFQISTMSQFSTIDIAFISGIDEKTADMEDRTNTLTGSQLTTLLAEKHVAFDEKFRECFNLSEEIDAKTLDVGKAAIGNMLGCIGYLYGQSKVYYHKSKHHFLHYWPAELYTSVPCRSKLPWGQLSDEGFHQMLIWRWDFRITLDIVGHWLDLMNVEGWIPREQILGLEALRLVSNCNKIKHDHVQYPDVVNPPTLLLVLCGCLIKKWCLYEKKFNDEESAENVSFLERAFARLEAWFQWLYTSQKGKKEGSFYWRGRDSTTDQELNPRTVASGMDDYPRASHPSDGEMHVDLRCWIYLAADCMKFITTFLQRKKTEEDYSSIVHQLSDFDDLNKMHYDRDHKTYLDFGNHTEKVRLVIEFGRGIRVTDEEPELKKVPHVGYASLFPFMSKIIPPHSEILEQQLDLISSNELACSDYGLLSLAKTRIKQIHSFVIIKSSMQLFVHDTERSDEPTTMLERSHMDEYELHDSCLPQTLLFSNVVGEYDKTRYIWERYDQTKGTGEGGRNFTGWSALILLIMTEDYPRL
ncbi:unnamed protein product [Brassica rapa]|uniref:Mannosyl-oligosaccharide glucosidase n=1 Tax=Brassica campestris TaxID=3711 RepID=A0A8D9MF31_BRACM|nr:unnamed protein product [Brassica rapa]